MGDTFLFYIDAGITKLYLERDFYLFSLRGENLYFKGETFYLIGKTFYFKGEIYLFCFKGETFLFYLTGKIFGVKAFFLLSF